ncbi:MAG: alpha/beta hydrolase [Pseudomonadota bacterium]
MNKHLVFLFGLATMMMGCTSCTSLFYQPNRVLYAHPAQLMIKDFQDLHWKSGEANLNAWYFNPNALKAKKSKIAPKGLILFFHGNAQNISSHFLNLTWILPQGYDFVIFDYRGYGLSSGQPNPDGVYQDSMTAMEEAWKIYKDNGYQKFIVFGQSLGGAIALRAMQDFIETPQISLLALDSTFLSYKKIAFDRLTSFWATFLLSPLAYLIVSDAYSPKDYVSQVPVRTLVIHGLKDQIIPFKFGEEIYNKLPDRKQFWQIPEGTHIDSFAAHGDKYQKQFVELLNSF